jgi:metal-responsive CopG/Arc/MetJ family transcriptional regulator
MSVQIEVDETILPEIDKLAKNSQKSRCDMVNEILRNGVRKETIQEKIRQFEESYRRFPQTPEELKELEEWQEIQDWGDEW